MITCELDAVSEALVVEDRPPLARELAVGIREAGVPAREAVSGLEALKLLNGQTSVALIDLRMPEMDGIQVAAEIQRRFNKIKIILYSAKGTDEFKIRAVSQGIRVERWIDKGPTIDEAVAAVVEIHQREIVREQIRRTIESRVKSAAERLNLTGEAVGDLLNSIDAGSLLIPKGTGIPSLPRHGDTDKHAIAHSFNDVLELITVSLDEAAAGYDDPAQREAAWLHVKQLVKQELWKAVEPTDNEYCKHLAIQLEHAIMEIDSALLALEHLKVAHVTLSLMRSSQTTQSDVSISKKAWRVAGVETLPTFAELIKHWEDLYGEDYDPRTDEV